MSEEPRHNYSAVLSYDGTGYYGWQRLREHATVQGAVEAALERFVGQPVAVRGAGRTDRGAHAEGQVAGFGLLESVEPEMLLRGLNRELPRDIRALAVNQMAPGFHVRTDAVEKTYEYRLVNGGGGVACPPTRAWHLRRPLDLSRVRTASEHLLGRRDFASFATKPRFEQRSTERELYEASLSERDGLVVLRFRANSFLNHMVRNMVGALAKVGEGRYEPGRIASILEARNRAASPGSAPARGLYLMKVRYERPL